MVTGVGLRRNHAIALPRLTLQQRGYYLASLVGSEMTTMDVGADDVVARLRIIANKVCELRRNPNKLTSTIAIVAIEDFALVADYRLMQAIELDVSSELTK